MNFVEELQWRGMLHTSIPETEAHLNAQMRKAYIGFDPTASSLGVGNMVQIMTLLHFQQSGHKPVALIGGATGMVGDPSGKSAERNLLGEEELRYNQECQQKQLERFLDFNCGDRSAEIVNNYDWFKEMGFLEFIRDVGKRLTVNYMMAKDSVKNRISGEDREGMSFTEFTYQLIQGYDFYYLWKNHGITLQMGGSDQWGNITTGTELIRRIDGGSAFALTTPLIKKADGTKFGKTESGNVWLDAARTSPYKFYQFWLNASDEDAKNFIRIFTLKGKEEIEGLEAQHLLDPGMRALQKALAEDITTRVHCASDTTQAIQASGILFSKDSMFDSLPKEMLLDIFDGVQQGTMSKTEIEAGADIIDVLVNSGFLPSKGEARRALQENSIAVNKEKVTVETKIDASLLIHGELIVLQRGKKNYFLLKCI
ncbi:MAG: tyrosine--tRNA ligase [Sediminibacterium sp.]